MLPKMKRDVATAWLKEVDSIAIQTSLKNLKDAYDRFFKKQNKAPRFKSKNNPVQSYTTKYTNGNIAILGNKIKLPRSEEHTSELQSRGHLVCRLLLEKKKK